MNFKFTIGDLVASSGQLELVEHEMKTMPLTPRLEIYRVVERLSSECCGGIQRFYHCEASHGGIPVRFAEDSLITSNEAWDRWMTAYDAQRQRLEAKIPHRLGPCDL